MTFDTSVLNIVYFTLNILGNTIKDITFVVNALALHDDVTVVKLRAHFEKAKEKMDGRWADCQIYFTLKGDGSDVIKGGGSDASASSLGPLDGFIFELQIAHCAYVNKREEVHDHYDYECVRLADVFMKSLK